MDGASRIIGLLHSTIQLQTKKKKNRSNAIFHISLESVLHFFPSGFQPKNIENHKKQKEKSISLFDLLSSANDVTVLRLLYIFDILI